MHPDDQREELFRRLLPIWEAIIADFVAHERRDRFLFLARSKKRQSTLCRELLHCPNDFKRHSVQSLTPKASRQTVASTLRQRGCKEPCIVMSIMGSVHGRELALEEGLNEVFNTSKESLLYFPFTHVAYYEGAHDDRAILVRNAGA